MKAAIENSRNATIFTATTLAPLGSSKAKDAVIPITKQRTAKAPEQITTDLKLRHRRMELSAGNTIRLDMSSAPIILMPSTTVTAVSTAMMQLYSSAFVPVALAKSSSKVTANILGYKNTNIHRTTTDSTMLKTASSPLSDRMLPNI